MKLKDISRTATFAWDQSSSSNPLLVTGAIAGALDENFSNESQLEIWAPDFGESQGLRLGGDGQGPAGSITVNSRCVSVGLEEKRESGGVIQSKLMVQIQPPSMVRTHGRQEEGRDCCWYGDWRGLRV